MPERRAGSRRMRASCRAAASTRSPRGARSLRAPTSPSRPPRGAQRRTACRRRARGTSSRWSWSSSRRTCHRQAHGIRAAAGSRHFGRARCGKRRSERPGRATRPSYAGYHASYPAKSEYLRRTSVWTDVTEILRGKTHPAQKPDPLHEIPIEVHTQPGEWVLDPFAGSGTRARAARTLGRRFILVEADAEQFERMVAGLRDGTAGDVPSERGADGGDQAEAGSSHLSRARRRA